MEEKIKHHYTQSKAQGTFRIALGSMDCVVGNDKSKDKVLFTKTDLDKKKCSLKYLDELSNGQAIGLGCLVLACLVFTLIGISVHVQAGAIRDLKVQIQSAEDSIAQYKKDLKGQRLRDQIDSIDAIHAETRLLRAAKDAIIQLKHDTKEKDELIQFLLKREEELKDNFASIHEALDDDEMSN